MKSYIKSLISKLGALFNRKLISSIEKISDNLTSLRIESLYNSLKYKEDHRILINFEEQVFSQNGEDGIISEIFDRIGIDSSILVEMGVGDGLENNTSFLLLQGWSGFWLEGNKNNVNKINEGFRKLIKDKKLITPSLNLGILSGTTRSKIETIAKKNNINCINRIINKSEVNTMDEAFICSSAIGILPCYWDEWESEYTITKKLQFLLEESTQK